MWVENNSQPHVTSVFMLFLNNKVSNAIHRSSKTSGALWITAPDTKLHKLVH